jgi:hypothetical protein
MPMRKRQEVQKMSRSIALALIFACSASAGIWPGQLGKYTLKSATLADLPQEERTRLQELGLEAAEQADYGQFQATAERFKDTTGAYAASLDPSAGTGSRVGNYVVSCHGNCPKDFSNLSAAGLPNPSKAAIPTLGGYLPAKGLIPHSERYIVGPVGLRSAAPQIPESALAFQFGTEAEFALYKAPGGRQQALAIFAFATPQLAREQSPALEAIPGAAVKRTGPLVAVVILSDGQADAKIDAAALLAQVNYGGSVAWNEPLPLIIRPQTMAQILVGIFTLAGVVIGFCVVSGLIFALIRIFARRFGYSGAEGTMTTLHLGGK